MRVEMEIPSEVVEAIATRAAEILEAEAGPEPFVGVDAAAEHLNCKRQRIYDLVGQGRIPHYKEGARLLFRRSELDGWLERG